MRKAWKVKVISMVTIQCSVRSVPRRASGMSYEHWRASGVSYGYWGHCQGGLRACLMDTGELRVCLMNTGELRACLMDTGDTAKEGFGHVLWTPEIQTRYWHFSRVGRVKNMCTMDQNYRALILAHVSLCTVTNFRVNLAVFLQKNGCWYEWHPKVSLQFVKSYQF